MVIVIVEVNSIRFLHRLFQAEVDKNQLNVVAMHYYEDVKPLFEKAINHVGLTQGFITDERITLPDKPIAITEDIVDEESQRRTVVLHFGINYRFTLAFVHALRNYLRGINEGLKKPIRY